MASQLWRCLRYLLIHFVFHLPRPRFHTVINDIIYATMPESSTNDEGTSRADEGDFRPEGCIPSHELCKECNVFFDDWEVLDWLENYKVSKTAYGWVSYQCPTAGKIYPFRKIAKLLQLQETCHFCIMLSSIIRQGGIGTHSNEYSDSTIEFRVGEHLHEDTIVVTILREASP